MATLNLIGQANRAQAIEIQFNFLKDLLEERRSFFERAGEKQTKWLKSMDDPVMILAKDMYEYLRAFFGEV